jgi:hypothetical protein
MLLADERGSYLAVNDEASVYLQLLSGKRLQGRKLVRRRDDSLVQCRYHGKRQIVFHPPHANHVPSFPPGFATTRAWSRVYALGPRAVQRPIR